MNNVSAFLLSPRQSDLALQFRRDGCAGPFRLVDETAAANLRLQYCAVAEVDPLTPGAASGVLTA